MSIWKDRPDLLDKLQALGNSHKLSMSQIASELGNGITRNAVCGKLYRLGIQCRPPLPSRRLAAKPLKLVPPPPVAPEPPAEPVKNGAQQWHHCRWPIGDPATPEFRFCGAKRKFPQPYCEKHIKMAISIQPKRSAR